MLLQVRREIIGFQKIPARGDCTTYASLTAGPAGDAGLAQTVDLNGNLDDQIAVLDLELVRTADAAARWCSASAACSAISASTATAWPSA